jgi:hypothetical protein
MPGIARQQIVARQERLALEIHRVAEAVGAGLQRVVAPFAHQQASAVGHGGGNRLVQRDPVAIEVR